MREYDPKEHNLCFVCRSFGHYARECQYNTEKCYRCGEIGHFARNCTNENGEVGNNEGQQPRGRSGWQSNSVRGRNRSLSRGRYNGYSAEGATGGYSTNYEPRTPSRSYSAGPVRNNQGFGGHREEFSNISRNGRGGRAPNGRYFNENDVQGEIQRGEENKTAEGQVKARLETAGAQVKNRRKPGGKIKGKGNT